MRSTGTAGGGCPRRKPKKKIAIAVGGNTSVNVCEGGSGCIGPAADVGDLSQRNIDCATRRGATMPQAVSCPCGTRWWSAMDEMEGTLQPCVHGSIGGSWLTW